MSEPASRLLWISTSSPASTANLGAGFDSLALAFDLRNEYELYADLRRLPENTVEFVFCDPYEGPYASTDRRMRTTNGNLFVQAFEDTRRYLCALARRPIPRCPCFVRQRVEIPPIRGLGSSSSACVAGALTGIEFFRIVYPRIDLRALLKDVRRTPINDQQFSEIVATLAMETDSCPDNVCASLVGGLTYCYCDQDTSHAQSSDGQVHFFRETIDDESLRCVILILSNEVDTVEARKLLERHQYQLRDVVFNIQRAVSFPRVLKDRRYDLLRDVTQDRIHQRQRAREFYVGDRGQPMNIDFVLGAVDEAGAYCAFISGAGSSLIALCDASNSKEIENAFRQAFSQIALSDWKIERVLTLAPTNVGATFDVQRLAPELAEGWARSFPQLQQWLHNLPSGFAPLDTRPTVPPGYAAFVSYNRRERDAVVELATLLERHSLSIWRDEEGFAPGEQWSSELEAAIEESRCFLLCVGPHGLGEFQKKEVTMCLDLAESDNRRVIPVILDGTDVSSLPDILTRYQFFWVRERSFDDDVRRLAEIVGR